MFSKLAVLAHIVKLDWIAWHSESFGELRVQRLTRLLLADKFYFVRVVPV